ncbi:beta-glucosidase [Geomicrobium sp. JCM 19037]|nr:beta-glucosidase [Geomicrobium sp. JCM 19037]
MKQTEQQTGIALNLSSHYPADDRPSSQEAATRADGFLNRWFLDPVYKGTYPKDMLTIYEKQTDLSFLQQGDLEQIQQPIDFLGINYYSSDFVESSPVTTENPTGSKPVQTSLPKTAMEWDVYPDGLYDLLVRVTNDYGKQPLYVSENGAAYRDEVVGGEVNDEQRADYLDQHLQSCLRAIQSGVDLRGYYVWSFLDNFEWAYGLSKRFGVVHIDFTTLKRTPKQSAYWLQAFIASQRVHS